MRLFHVDAFTDARFAGNPANVVLDADGQSDASMLGIAREFSNAETAFVLGPTGADHDLTLRFFNARKEAPFVGHATVAAHAVLLELGRRGQGPCRQRSGTGIIEVDALLEPAGDGERTIIEFRQSKPELENPLPLKTTLRVAKALRLPATSLHELLPARIARKGSSRLLLPVSERGALDELAPNFESLVGIGRDIGAEGFFVFAHGREPQGLQTDSRMFCPALGIPEDPVSGNAHAMLACYLLEHGIIDAARPGFVGAQGRQMHRPGQVRVKLEFADGALIAVRIGGAAVIVSEGTLRV
ncbi:MAG TPA: PhzF family phenazine biosynthesis isomerase [Steroidobacteraceae bacterium]|nr:PhzF family phenazine biosynthesis isomerase [Steroidobacteraceae bacterium]